MQITAIASGSNGNSTLIEDKETKILIDAGISGKEIERRLKRLGKSLEDLDAAILTHAHSDHYQSIGVIARRYGCPLYIRKETYSRCAEKLGRVTPKFYQKGQMFKIDNLTVSPVCTSHDMDSCGFVIGDFGIFTDTGIITKEMRSSIRKLRGMLLESNHDIDMLLRGPYPPFLKNRILSEGGHLSNLAASEFIQDRAASLDWAMLGHLSGNNNTPEHARSAFESIVKRKIDFEVLSRHRESSVWEL